MPGPETEIGSIADNDHLGKFGGDTTEGIIGRGIIDDDDTEISKGKSVHRTEAAKNILAAVIIKNLDGDEWRAGHLLLDQANLFFVVAGRPVSLPVPDEPQLTRSSALIVNGQKNGAVARIRY